MFPAGSVIGRPCSDGRDHGLFDQINFTRFGVIRGVDDGAFFHLRDLTWNANDDARMHQHFTPVRFLDEVVEHTLSDFEVGDNAVLHGADGNDRAGCAPQHLLRFLADRLYFGGVFVHRNDGGFVDDDTLALGEHQRVGSAKIDCEI